MEPQKAPAKSRRGQSKQLAQEALTASKAKPSTSASLASEDPPKFIHCGRTLRQTRPFGCVQHDEQSGKASSAGSKRKRETPLEAANPKKRKTATGSKKSTAVSAPANIALGSPITSREPSPELQLTTVNEVTKASSQASSLPANTQVPAVEAHSSTSLAATSLNGTTQDHAVSNHEVSVVPDATKSLGQSSDKESSDSRRSSGSTNLIRGSNVANKGEQWRQLQERERRRAQNKRAMAVDDETIQQLREERIRREIQQLRETRGRREPQSRTLSSLTPPATSKGLHQPRIEESLSASSDHGQPVTVDNDSERRDSVTATSEERTSEEPKVLDPAIVEAAGSIGIDMINVSSYLDKAEKLIPDTRLIPAAPTDACMTKTELTLLARNEARKSTILEEARVIVAEGKRLMAMLKDPPQYQVAINLLVDSIVDDWRDLGRHINDLTKVGLWD